MTSSSAWATAREQIPLDPTVCMLNTGSFGPTPRPVFDCVTELRRRLAAGPTDFFVRQMPPLLWNARVRTAAFLGTLPTRLIFTTNVSSAINLIASGLTIPSPGEILMTDHEYLAMKWCWERAAQLRGLTIRTFPLPQRPKNESEIVDAASRAMTPRTRMLFFSHVLSPTGMVLPAKELCAEARRRGIVTVVDGAHAPAMLPLNVSDVNGDFYAGNLHKWLLAPIGAGFLVVGPGNEDRLRPLEVSWGYHQDASAPELGPDEQDRYGSTPRTRFLEFEGTRDVCPWLAVPSAIDFQTELGWEAVRTRIAELAAYTRKCIARLGLELATPEHPRLHGAMTAMRLPEGISAPRLRQELWAKRIEAPINELADRKVLRVSHHFYTTEAEIDHLFEVLPKLLATK